MNRNLTYLVTLNVFFFLWEVFGFAAAAPGGGTLLQSDISPADQAALNADTRRNPPLIPVTGDTQPGPVLFVYGLIGLLTLTLILALLNAANKSTALSFRRKEPSDRTDKK